MTTSAAIAVCAVPDEGEPRARAEALAAKLNLPLADPTGRVQYDLLLTVTQGRLELRRTGQRTAGPVYAEFVGGRMGRRRKSPAFGAAMLARAVGFKKPPWRVCDATAGLGGDAFLLALVGCTVTAVERSAVLAAALMADGLERASAEEALAGVVRERLRLVVGEAREVLADPPRGGRFDAVYLDPMFPARAKSAATRKEMQICRLAAGDDPDARGLLDVALAAARSRVVVKRSLRAQPLRAGAAFTHKGQTIRYDVYLPPGP